MLNEEITPNNLINYLNQQEDIKELNYKPKNDAVFLINAISTGFENLEEKQKKRVHALVFEIVKDL